MQVVLRLFESVGDGRDALLIQGSGFRVQGSGFRVQGSGFRVQGSRFRFQGTAAPAARTAPAGLARTRKSTSLSLSLLRSSLELSDSKVYEP